MLDPGELAGRRAEPGLQLVNRLAMARAARGPPPGRAPRPRASTDPAQLLHEADENGRSPAALAELGIEIGRQAVLMAHRRLRAAP